MSSVINPYELFGLTANSSLKELREAYYRFALMCHPDKGGASVTMNQITLAYQWIRQQLTDAEEHRQTFEAYYGEKIKEAPKVKAFTDILAETYEYTRERFKEICQSQEINIKTDAVIDMLFVPAFEWALQEKATVDNLWEKIPLFLKMYIGDSTKNSPVEFYVPMCDPRGYDDVITQHASNETSYESHRDQYRSTLVTYEAPQTLSLWKDYGAQCEPTKEKPNFTVFDPTAVYDYEEAFQTPVLPHMDYEKEKETESKTKTMKELDCRIDERKNQDEQWAMELEMTQVSLQND
jgi:hypothetical protein